MPRAEECQRNRGRLTKGGRELLLVEVNRPCGGQRRRTVIVVVIIIYTRTALLVLYPDQKLRIKATWLPQCSAATETRCDTYRAAAVDDRGQRRAGARSPRPYGPWRCSDGSHSHPSSPYIGPRLVPPRDPTGCCYPAGPATVSRPAAYAWRRPQAGNSSWARSSPASSCLPTSDEACINRQRPVRYQMVDLAFERRGIGTLYA